MRYARFGEFNASTTATVQNAVDDAQINYTDLPSALAYIRNNWSSFSNIGTTIFNLQHQASQLAVQAQQAGRSDIQQQMQSLITQLGQWNTMASSIIDEYDFLQTGLQNLGLDLNGNPQPTTSTQMLDAGTYLGQEPVTIAAALATAVIIVGTIGYLLYHVGSTSQQLATTQQTLSLLGAGKITPADATSIINRTTTPAPGMLQSLQGIAGYLAIGAVAIFVLPELLKSGKGRRR